MLRYGTVGCSPLSYSYEYGTVLAPPVHYSLERRVISGGRVMQRSRVTYRMRSRQRRHKLSYEYDTAKIRPTVSIPEATENRATKIAAPTILMVFATRVARLAFASRGHCQRRLKKHYQGHGIRFWAGSAIRGVVTTGGRLALRRASWYVWNCVVVSSAVSSAHQNRTRFFQRILQILAPVSSIAKLVRFHPRDEEAIPRGCALAVDPFYSIGDSEIICLTSTTMHQSSHPSISMVKH